MKIVIFKLYALYAVLNYIVLPCINYMPNHELCYTFETNLFMHI